MENTTGGWFGLFRYPLHYNTINWKIRFEVFMKEDSFNH